MAGPRLGLRLRLPGVRLFAPSLASPSRPLLPLLHRAYATAVSLPSSSSSAAHAPPPTTPSTAPARPPSLRVNRSNPRVYPRRKAFSHAHLSLLVSSSPLILLLTHSALPAAFLAKFRRDVARAVNPPLRGSPRLLEDEPGTWPGRKPDAKLHVIRGSILGAVLREQAPQMYSVHEALKGPMAALAYPVLDPPVLAALLRAVDRASAQLRAADLPTGKKHRPTMQLVGALVGGQVMYDPQLRETSRLPRLDTLRAQIVGLLSAPAAQISGVLEQARGGRHVRLLDSYAKGGEEGQKEA
ncbi:hypothetical protein CALCODRAFT_501600 [Calocera cornea HHB12733]|uniref:Ribosomal protein L10 n=1 Tax=Calocera cornea HHB12733 TaxID=1353952 RepID=A0A165DKB3_9BASI|nr:hypothetical protein CALCODRAFT_501600 [Calocera cornea HHB12733]